MTILRCRGEVKQQRNPPFGIRIASRFSQGLLQPGCSGRKSGYFPAAFLSRSNFSAPTHSLAKAHHSMQDVPMGRAFVWPHFLHVVSGSSDQISIFSPHCWHRISSGLGERISALPGHPSLNMIQ
jgi:hypothetical protein